MKIVNENGVVTFVMKAGKDFVKDTMSLNEAERIVKTGKTSKSTNLEGYNLSVDDKYFFVVEKDSTSKSKKSAESE